MASLYRSAYTILSWDYKIVNVFMNCKPECENHQSNCKSSYDIDQTVHTKVNSSYKRRPKTILEIYRWERYHSCSEQKKKPKKSTHRNQWGQQASKQRKLQQISTWRLRVECTIEHSVKGIYKQILSVKNCSPLNGNHPKMWTKGQSFILLTLYYTT